MSHAQRRLPQLNETVVLGGFVSTTEHKQLLHWAETQFVRGALKPNLSGEGRFFHSYGKSDPSVPAAFWKVRRRAISTFSVTEFEDEPAYRCFLGCNTEGGFVHRHIDAAPPRMLHVRMNVMLSKPAGGGVPIIDGRELQVEERDLWCFFPSVMPHESTPVRGERKRFVLSIGILVPRRPAQTPPG